MILILYLAFVTKQDVSYAVLPIQFLLEAKTVEGSNMHIDSEKNQAFEILTN